MNVIIKINGRDAIPVRALPWLTHGRLFSAQDVADALSVSAKFSDFSSLHPFLIDGGIVNVDFWRNVVQGKLKCLEAQGIEPEQWLVDSLAALPAGVFVWRDEWESAYNQSPFGPDVLAALGDAADKQDISERTLNFAPHIPNNLVQLVMEASCQQLVNAEETQAQPEVEKPLQRSLAQDAAILHEIKKQGYNPQRLPKNPAGKPGVKASIRSAIDGRGLFLGETIFKKSWERLSANGEIVTLKQSS